MCTHARTRNLTQSHTRAFIHNMLPTNTAVVKYSDEINFYAMPKHFFY